jgi:DUF177 domain-containing protein
VTRPFTVPTGELFRHRGARHQVVLSGPLPGLALSSSHLTADDVVADVVVEAQGDEVIVSGTVTATWAGECRRCLGPTGGEVTLRLREVFEPDPVEGETYPLGRDELDLGPALRESLALALPLAPLCSEDCAGPDPADYPVTGEADAEADTEGDDAEGHDSEGHNGANGVVPPAADPRWGALDALRFDS